MLWHGLAEPTSRVGPPTPAEVSRTISQRLSPLAMSFVAHNDIEISRDDENSLRVDAFKRLVRIPHLLSAANLAIEALNERGIGAVVAKGPGIATYYPSPELRPFSDIDLLIPSRSFGQGLSILQSLGFAERLENVQPWPYFDRWCREAINLESDAGGSIDLHHHVSPWIWARSLSHDSLPSSPVGNFGITLPCLSVEANLLVAALHVVSDHNRPGQTLLIWRDVTELARASNVAVIVSLAKETGLTDWLRSVLQALPSEVRPAELLSSLPVGAGPIAGTRLSALLSGGRRSSTLPLSQMLRLPLPQALAFFVGMAIPSRRFLEHKYPDASRKYATWWRGREGPK